MEMIKKIKSVAESYQKCKNDMERLSCLKENNEYLKVVLDNDVTMVDLIRPKGVSEEEFELVINNMPLPDFDNYHYWSDGCLLLFEFAGITAESC